MNKEAFQQGFIKAALSNGLDILQATQLLKASAAEEHNKKTQRSILPALAMLGSGAGLMGVSGYNLYKDLHHNQSASNSNYPSYHTSSSTPEYSSPQMPFGGHALPTGDGMGIQIPSYLAPLLQGSTVNVR